MHTLEEILQATLGAMAVVIPFAALGIVMRFM